MYLFVCCCCFVFGFFFSSGSWALCIRIKRKTYLLLFAKGILVPDRCSCLVIRFFRLFVFVRASTQCTSTVNALSYTKQRPVWIEPCSCCKTGCNELYVSVDAMRYAKLHLFHNDGLCHVSRFPFYSMILLCDRIHINVCAYILSGYYILIHRFFLRYVFLFPCVSDIQVKYFTFLIRVITYFKWWFALRNHSTGNILFILCRVVAPFPREIPDRKKEINDS